MHFDSYPFDFSTINADVLRKLPVHANPHGCHYGGHGSACFCDAPGFPSYFVQPVCTSQGESPRKGATVVLCYPREAPRVIEWAEWNENLTWEEHHAAYITLLHRLWVPLPLDHPRTRAWIRRQYQYFARCYNDTTKPVGDRDHLIVWPLSSTNKLRSFRDDPRFSEEWRTAEKAHIEAANAETIAYYQQFILPENHQAVVSIREFYPEYQPETDLIDNPPKERIATWWERYAEQPTAEQCCGLGHGHPHPIGSPCQTCGR